MKGVVFPDVIEAMRAARAARQPDCSKRANLER